MAGSVNKVILVGNLGRDPEIRSTTSGQRIANFSLATSENWRDRATGERKERTEWHRVVVFNERLVEVIEKYVKKGSKLYIEGALQTRKWTDNSGQERYTTEIVLQNFRGELTMLDGRWRRRRRRGRGRRQRARRRPCRVRPLGRRPGPRRPPAQSRSRRRDSVLIGDFRKNYRTNPICAAAEKFPNEANSPARCEITERSQFGRVFAAPKGGCARRRSRS